ncbi:MAG TPA: tetratricopeptide repeat protein [Terriglobales bacterium]|nr:tetratricopeptide repeat protein [Terriglobales bacterium]
MLYRFSLLLLIVVVATLTFAQNSPFAASLDYGYHAGLSGTVRDNAGNAVSNAHIEIRDVQSGRIVGSTYTSPNGRYEAFNLPRGDYEITASVGIIESRARLELDMPRELDFHLITNAEAAGAPQTSSVALSQMKVPGKARKLFDKAMAAFRAAHIDDAFNLVQKAITSCPEYAQALTLRGLLNMERGDNKSAQPDLEKAVELDYADDMNFVALATLYNTEGKYDEALRVLDRGMTVHPNSWQALMETARAQNGRKHYEEALKALAKADSYLPAGNTYKYLYSAQAFVGLHNYPAAITQLQSFLAKESTGPNVQTARKTLDQLQNAVIQEAKK